MDDFLTGSFSDRFRRYARQLNQLSDELHFGLESLRRFRTNQFADTPAVFFDVVPSYRERLPSHRSKCINQHWVFLPNNIPEKQSSPAALHHTIGDLGDL